MRTENYWKLHPIDEYRIKTVPQYNEALETCFEYSDNPDKLKNILDTITIRILFEGIKKHFIDDKDPRQVITVRITKKENPNSVLSFEFGMSLNDTEILEANNQQGINRKLFKKAQRIKYHLIYSLLACIKSDSYCPELFEDFCSDYGYDSDSIKAKNIFDTARPHAIKINRFFTSEELESFPS